MATSVQFEHHDRLARLEDGYGEVASLVAAQRVSIDNLADKIKEGFARIDQRLDSIQEDQAAHRDRLATLEIQAQSTSKWIKGAAAAIGALIGWIGQAFVRAHLG